MAADDQLINLEVLKRQLADLGLHEKCTYCIDGQQIIEKSKGVLEEAIAVAQTGQKVKPIDFMLLDFQMPKKNGIQVVMEVRDFYSVQSQMHPELKLEEPLFVFLTAFSTIHFRKHLATLGVTNIFEKPIQLEQLKIIFEQNA